MFVADNCEHLRWFYWQYKYICLLVMGVGMMGNYAKCKFIDIKCRWTSQRILSYVSLIHLIISVPAPQFSSSSSLRSPHSAMSSFLTAHGLLLLTVCSPLWSIFPPPSALLNLAHNSFISYFPTHPPPAVLGSHLPCRKFWLGCRMLSLVSDRAYPPCFFKISQVGVVSQSWNLPFQS